MAQVILYVDGATRTVLTTQPDITGKAVIEVNVPEGLPITFLLNQLQTLENQISLPSNQAQAALIVVKLIYGTT